MKVKIINILITFFVFLSLLASCKKDEDRILEKQMNTWQVRNITSTSAELGGIIVSDGTDDLTGYSELGVCWSENHDPTVTDSNISVKMRKKAIYWVEAKGLKHLTEYYARAYAISPDGSTTYGEETSFTTLANVPYVSINEASNVEGKSVDITYNLTSDGKAKVSEKGICWSKKQNPTVEDSVIKADNQDMGELMVPVEKLEGHTTYYVRAYAKNSIGVGYSKEITFITNVASPTLTTDSIIDITSRTLMVYGAVVVDGGSEVTERGFCWSKSEAPEITDAKVVLSSGLGSYNAIVPNLEPETEYHVRAYATNALGTAYGNELKVKTVMDIQKLYVPGGYQAASGYGEGDWKPESAPFIISSKDNKELEGYVYFASASEFKLTTDPDWAHTNYGDGGGGKLSTDGGNISVSQAGLYLIKANLSELTYSLTKVKWSLIGDAVGGWDSDKAEMVYNKFLKRVVATATFVDGGFKMRANANWDIDLGDNGQDATLEYAGDNISVSAGTYTFMVDLSTREYKGVLTHWGVIGDAVGGWESDHDMTADVAKNTWTYTGDFAKGTFKFRANDGWAINLGGDINNLSFDGADIEIAESGNYTVILDLVNNKCTVTKN